jgi:putative transposase
MPPKGRTWGPRGHIPVVTVTGGSNARVSVRRADRRAKRHAARLIYRTRRADRGRDQRNRISKSRRRMHSSGRAW